MAKTRPESELPVEKYIRLVDVTREDDMLPAWQPEVIEVQGSKVISKKLEGNRDVWIMAFSRAQELIDPRNKE